MKDCSHLDEFGCLALVYGVYLDAMRSYERLKEYGIVDNFKVDSGIVKKYMRIKRSHKLTTPASEQVEKLLHSSSTNCFDINDINNTIDACMSINMKSLIQRFGNTPMVTKRWRFMIDFDKFVK